MECIFCGEVPCICNKPVRKVSARKPPPPAKITPTLAVTGSADLPVFAPPTPAPKAKPVLVVEEDPEFVACLRALEPIMHEEERALYSVSLSLPQTRQERIVAWQRLCSWRKAERAKTTAK